MVIPIGTRVRIRADANVIPSCLRGVEAKVIGYEEHPPNAITRLLLERDGDVTFKWPKEFPWDLEILAEEESRGFDSH